VQEIAEQVGASDLLERRPRTLSGGEAQRVALARALATEPRCLMLDEPLASLDAAPSDEIQRLLRELNRTQNCTFLHVTHDFEEALSMASRVAIMKGGTICREGSPEEVFRHPQSEFEARMAGIRNFFRGELRRTTGEEATFHTNGLEFVVLTNTPDGGGYLIVRSTDVTLSEHRTHTSARNCIQGTVADVAGAQGGLEVTVDIDGLHITAMITHRSAEKLGLTPGARTWVSFKASAARFVPAR
jgi:molybdopterin-binding protein